MGVYRTPGVYIEPAGERIQRLDRVETGICAFVGVTAKGPVNDPQRFDNYAKFENVFGDDGGYTAHAVRGFFDNGGAHCVVVNVARKDGRAITPDDFIGGRGTAARGLRMLEDVEDVDLLACPDIMRFYRQSPGFMKQEDLRAVQDAMLTHCAKRYDRFAILDCPPGLNLREAAAWKKNYDSSFGALYYPWVIVREGTAAGPPIPPSGHVAGMTAKADRTEGVFRAPANILIEGIVDIDTRVNRRERDVLFENHVNGLYPFPARGVRVWGARTLSSDPAWRHIPVRRLFQMVRRSIDRYAQWVVFEPNEPRLWKQLQRTISGFLFEVWKEGGLVGETQNEAFYVKCDDETNPPEQQERGELVCEIGLSPVKPAEFLVVRIHQWTREATDEDKEAAGG